MKPSLKILFLSRWFPFPLDNGSKIRIYNLIAHLSERHRVDLLAFSDAQVTSEQQRELERFCRRVETTTYRSFQPQSWHAVLGFFSRYPRSVKDTYSKPMARMVEKALGGEPYDVVIASQLDMAPYALLAKDAARVLEEIELTTLYEASFQPAPPVTRARRIFMWRKWTHYLAGLLPAFHGATVVSELELERVREATPTAPPFQIIPNGVDFQALQGDFGLPQPGKIVFSGSLTYGPNYEAMQFFLRDIFPLVKQCIPSVSISITGRLDGVPLDQLPDQDAVHFTGFLDDVRPVIASSWANAVPLLSGGGTRLKVIESLAIGTPVVSTAKGVEGLELSPGREYLQGEDPASFAVALVELLQDADLRARLSVNGQRVVAERYNWEKIGPCFCDFIETVAEMRRPL